RCILVRLIAMPPPNPKGWRGIPLRPDSAGLRRLIRGHVLVCGQCLRVARRSWLLIALLFLFVFLLRRCGEIFEGHRSPLSGLAINNLGANKINWGKYALIQWIIVCVIV